MPRKNASQRELADAIGFKPHYLEHRSRLQERLLKGGAENLPDYEILEILLAASNPRGDTKPLAKALIDRFGGLAEVLSADPETLQQVKGIDGEGRQRGVAMAGAAMLKAVREAALRLSRAHLTRSDVTIGSWDKLIDYCKANIAHGTVEEFHLLFLDRKNALIRHERQQRGTIDHTPVYPREVVKRALALDASALILVHNQIGRRLTERLQANGCRHRLLLMLDEFPALGRLDFFESALAFMAGYGLKSFLIAQSLNQIEKAYGPNNSILDNCHVRVAFATNDERTARRVSDALGTATELRAMKNYAGHRLSPWLGHLMVSRQETARALMTPGEVMQLPPTDEIVLVSGTPPIRAKKARYYEDGRLESRALPPPSPAAGAEETASPSGVKPSDWELAATPQIDPSISELDGSTDVDTDNAGIRREPELPEHEAIAPEGSSPAQLFEFAEDEPDDNVSQKKRLRDRMHRVARQIALDPDDGMEI